MTIEIVTFGCRLNTYESEVMRAHAEKAGLKDTIIFNTCAVTKEAERQAQQAIRRAKRDNPNANIIVTGCAAQVNPQKYAGLGEVNLVLGNEEKMKAESWSALNTEPVLVNDIMSVKETAGHLISGFEGHT
ncbi:MAG: tRNA (N(6)-L-threonylcarbamoyladenosine(37)-C(2))-methylthiotransferase MtaB, partial [Alphaproteobacteria bacterium]|nr:tRNA (N(6)-L-threonylcarbamoyladenosine(37)-C(2))-methylthiotransferase MtaB [Alphaproteobacteria bacterium]